MLSAFSLGVCYGTLSYSPKKISFASGDSPQLFFLCPSLPVFFCPFVCLVWSPALSGHHPNFHSIPASWLPSSPQRLGAKILLCSNSLPLEQSFQVAAFPEGPSGDHAPVKCKETPSQRHFLAGEPETGRLIMDGLWEAEAWAVHPSGPWVLQGRACSLVSSQLAPFPFFHSGLGCLFLPGWIDFLQSSPFHKPPVSPTPSSAQAFSAKPTMHPMHWGEKRLDPPIPQASQENRLLLCSAGRPAPSIASSLRPLQTSSLAPFCPSDRGEPGRGLVRPRGRQTHSSFLQS